MVATWGAAPGCQERLDLPPDILARVATFLPRNYVASTFRIVNKWAADAFREHATLRLSEEVPETVYAAKWASAEACHGLTYTARRRLVCLTAASNNVANLDVAIRAAGCGLTADLLGSALAAAAAAGALACCQRLAAAGCCSRSCARGLVAAAAAGQRAACEWCLANGCGWSMAAVWAAASGGHTELMAWLWGLRHTRAADEGNGGLRANGNGDRDGNPGLIEDHNGNGNGNGGSDGNDRNGNGGGDGNRGGGGGEEDRGLIANGDGDGDGDGEGSADGRIGPNALLLWLVAAAEGCDLPGLQGVMRTVQAHPTYGEVRSLGPPWRLVLAAAGSAILDWRSKVEWLEGEQGLHADGEVCGEAVLRRADAAERLTWLRGRGYPPEPWHVHAAADAGNLEALQWLLDQGLRPDPSDPWLGPARRIAPPWAPDTGPCAGAPDPVLRLDVLRAMHAAGCEVDAGCCAWRAAAGRQIPELGWLVGTYGLSTTLAVLPSRAVTCSGSVAVMAWFRSARRGPPWDASAWAGAVEAGCEAALEYLAEQRCPLPPNAHELYLSAALEADLATLAALRRLRVPLGPRRGASLLRLAICRSAGWGAPVQALQALRELGCAVRWEEALAAAQGLGEPGRGQVVSWLERERRASGEERRRARQGCCWIRWLRVRGRLAA